MPSLKSLLLGALPFVVALPAPVETISKTVTTGGITVSAGATIEGGSSAEISDMVQNMVDNAISKISAIIANPDASNVIPNRYIVVYNSTFDDDAVAANSARFSAKIAKRNLHKRDMHGKRQLSTTVHTMKINGWRAMSLDADDDMITEIYNSDEVEYVEADTMVSTNAMVAQTNAPTGVNRLSHDRLEASYIFDDSAGQGVTAYVLDTGVLLTHTEFEGRASFGANFVDNVNTDENGHGSHVAGTIAGATFGVAKSANIVDVKVLGRDGSGANSGVIQGMQWIIDDVNKKGLKGKAIMNMSLGGSFSQAINRAIQGLFDAGIVPVVAAGNDGIDTVLSSPGSSPNAITVGAIDATKGDKIVEFSNFGTPVDVFAHGVEVMSVGIQSNTAVNVLSGTSMACPHIAGLAAYLMTLHKLTNPTDVAAKVKSLATASTGRVANVLNRPGTTNLIATNGNIISI